MEDYNFSYYQDELLLLLPPVALSFFTLTFLLLYFQSHIIESSQPSRVGAAAVLEFWVGILTQQNLWYRDKTVLFLMDQICCTAFTYHQEECVQKLLYQLHKVRFAYLSFFSSLVAFL